MKIDTKDRSRLRSYFKKNQIPTENDFSDLIGAMLNQKDDGIVKLPDNPLSIEAEGDNATQQKVLNIYSKLNDNQPSWSLSLNPRVTPDIAASTSRRGFSISDKNSKSRLFIDEQTGNVGLGTIEPKGKLDIHGSLVFDGNRNIKLTGEKRKGSDALVIAAKWGELEIKGRVIDWIGGTLHIGYENDNRNGSIEIGRKVGSTVFLSGGGTAETMRITGGKVGIGTASPSSKLHVKGSIRVDGNLYLSSGSGITTENWKSVSFVNKCTNWSKTYNNAEYYKDPFNIIHLRGLVKINSNVIRNKHIFTLPEGCRPRKRGVHVTISMDKISKLHISSNGQVDVMVGHLEGKYGWVSLDGITFKATKKGLTIIGNWGNLGNFVNVKRP